MKDFIFLGHCPTYWMELQKKADKLNVTDILQELADAYGKIAFYEKRIDELASIRNK